MTVPILAMVGGFAFVGAMIGFRASPGGALVGAVIGAAFGGLLVLYGLAAEAGNENGHS